MLDSSVFAPEEQNVHSLNCPRNLERSDRSHVRLPINILLLTERRVVQDKSYKHTAPPEQRRLSQVCYCPNYFPIRELVSSIFQPVFQTSMTSGFACSLLDDFYSLKNLRLSSTRFQLPARPQQQFLKPSCTVPSSRINHSRAADR